MIPAIEVSHIVKHYGSLRALDRIDLTVAQGEFFGLLGPNGAGKTTLISIIAGLTRATSGTARVMGHDVIADYRAARRSLGVVPQELVFDPFFTVREALKIQSGYYGIRDNDAWIDEVIEHLDLTSKANTNMRALSGGMKRRVLVGQALVHKPPVIVLDEPTAGVDVELRQALWRFIRRLNRDGHTIVLTTQNLLRRHSGCYVELRVDPDRLPERLEPRVVQRRDKGEYRLAMKDYDEVAELIVSLRDAGVKVHELEVLHPDLEEVFVQIMNK